MPSDYLPRLLLETREELQRADNKANMILGASGVATGATIAGIIAGDVGLAGEDFVVWLLSLSAGLFIVGGLISLGRAVSPTVGIPEAGRARYFAEVAQHKDLRTATEVLLREGTEQTERDAHQIFQLSKLACSKYAHTRAGMKLIGVGYACAGLAGLLSRAA